MLLLQPAGSLSQDRETGCPKWSIITFSRGDHIFNLNNTVQSCPFIHIEVKISKSFN